MKPKAFVLSLSLRSFLNVRADDIYSYAVSKTLTKISSPATVGLYSACQNRLNMILEQIQGMSKLWMLDVESSVCKMDLIFFLQIGTFSVSYKWTNIA